MLPRALLFSSDQATSCLLTETLAEAQFETEHCSEILVAVEQLTRGIFQIVLTDWDQPFEASFLLKTARELKTTESILAVAVVRPEDADNAVRAGANAVLTKPCSVEQVKNTLFAARDVLVDAPVPAKQELPPRIDDSIPGNETIPNPLPQRFLPAELETLPVSAFPPREPEPAIQASAFAPLTYEELAQELRQPRRYLRTSVAAAALVALVVLLYGAWRLGFLSPETITYYALTVPAPVVGDTSLHRDTWPLASSHAQDPTQVDVLPIVRDKSLEITRPQSLFPALPTPLQSLPQPVEPGALPLIRPLFPVSSTHPQIPPSLAAPFPAMSAVSSPKLDNLNTKWTVEPPLLPEEVTRALLVHEPAPAYPEPALHAGLQGTVVLQVWIAKDGTVRDAKLLRGPLPFGQAAFDAVRQWRYKPYLSSKGEPIEVQTLITMDFKQP
jgi:TonB family protein